MNILVIFKNKILRRFKKELQLVKSSNVFYNSSIVVKKSCLSSNIVIGKNSKILNSNLNFKGSIGNDTLINEAKVIGKLDCEEGCKFYKCELAGNIRIGKYTSLWGPNLDIYSGYQTVFIGNFCSIARNVSMQTYNHNMNKITKINPTIKDVIPDFIESSPKSGPTVLSSTTSNGVGKAPDLSNNARSVAS